MASLSNVPVPRWLYIVSSVDSLLCFCSLYSTAPLPSPQQTPATIFFSSWRFPPFSLFLPGTKGPNPQVFFIPSFLSLTIAAQPPESAEGPHIVPYICPISFIAMSLACHWRPQLVQQCDYWSAWLHMFPFLIYPWYDHQKVSNYLGHGP